MRPRMAFVLWLRAGDQPARRASWLSTLNLLHKRRAASASSPLGAGCYASRQRRARTPSPSDEMAAGLVDSASEGYPFTADGLEE